MSRKIYKLFAGEDDTICPLLKEIMPAPAAGRTRHPQPADSLFNQGIGFQPWPGFIKKLRFSWQSNFL
jgi:hypothetical protein